MLTVPSIIVSIFVYQHPRFRPSAGSSVSPPPGFNGGRIEPDRDRVVYTYWVNGKRSEDNLPPNYPFSKDLPGGGSITVQNAQEIILGWGVDGQGNCFIPISVDPVGQGIRISSGEVLFNWSTAEDKAYVKVLDVAGNPWRGSGDIKVTARAPDGRTALLYVYGAKCAGGGSTPTNTPTPKPPTNTPIPTKTSTPTPTPTSTPIGCSSCSPSNPYLCTSNSNSSIKICKPTSSNSGYTCATDCFPPTSTPIPTNTPVPTNAPTPTICVTPKAVTDLKIFCPLCQ